MTRTEVIAGRLFVVLPMLDGEAYVDPYAVSAASTAPEPLAWGQPCTLISAGGVSLVVLGRPAEVMEQIGAAVAQHADVDVFARARLRRESSPPQLSNDEMDRQAAVATYENLWHSPSCVRLSSGEPPWMCMPDCPTQRAKEGAND